MAVVAEAIDEIRSAKESLPAVRYNSRMLQFLCQQLGKVEDILTDLPNDELEGVPYELKKAAERGSLLVKRHADVFRLEKFYKVGEVACEVQTTCRQLAGCLSHLDLREEVRIQVAMDELVVEEDKDYMYWYLTCILDGKMVDRNIPADVRRDLEAQITSRRESMQEVQIIDERQLEKMGKIGKGGHGDVEKAMWRGQAVAVKTLQKDFSPEARAEFITEVAIHTRMRHPNVVRCFGATASNAIVMELADYDLEKFLEQSGAGQPWEWKVGLMVSASAGLKFLHQSRVVHRDVKCANFLVFVSEGSPVIKIGDFGLALVKTESRSKTGKPLMGTPLWMAPEIHEGHPHSFRSDVFSFGLVLYMIASGCQPYRGIGHHEKLLKGRKAKGEEPCLLPNDCPPRLSALMLRCISRQNRERPTMMEVDMQLQEIMLECASSLPAGSYDVEMEG